MTELPKKFNSQKFNEMTKDVKIPKDKSQFIIDLSKNQIICTKCKAWVRIEPLIIKGQELMTSEQVKENFKAKHLKSCK
jgi:hypothetical protein